MSPRFLLILIALLASAACAATAQVVQSAEARPRSDSLEAPAAVAARWPTEHWLHHRSSLEFELTGPLGPGEQLGVLIHETDVSAFTAVVGTRARVDPSGWTLPSGESAVVLFIIDSVGRWREVGRAPIRVLTHSGLERASIIPSAELISTGILDHGAAPAVVATPARRAYQDLTLRMGLANEFARRGWRVIAQGNAIGVTQETQRLRWSQLQSAAPMVDLSDYRLQVARGPHEVALGNVIADGHRHLISGFSSRGVKALAGLGRHMALSGALVNGSNLVGWGNLVGIGEPMHRIATGTLSMELVPERAGALRVELSMVDGSILPRDGYTRIAVTDAEASRGWGAQLTARDARERIRVSTGIARSRFVNPVDPLLAGDTTAVAVDPTARAARYGELAVQLPADQKIAGRLPVALSATIRHERVDPLYRSVGASVASDVAQDGLDIAARIGALALQAAATSGRDNLADIPSVLTSHTASRSVQGSLSIADLSRMPDAWFLPSFQYALQHTHQNGTGVPANGDFSDTHVPDQLSTVRSASVSWSAAAMNLVYRWNASFQDNRQPGRERADFRGEVHAVTLGTTLLRMMSASVEGSVERQSTLESGLTQRTARLGASSEFRLGSATVLSTAFSRAHSSDPFANRTMRNTELHAELSRGFNLYRRKAGATQGRTFLRYARTTAVLVAPSDPSNALTWTLNAGGSIRLY